MIGLQPTSVGARAVRYLRGIDDPNEWVFTIPLAYVIGVENAKALPVLLKHVHRLELVEKRHREGQKQAEWRARPGSWNREDPNAELPLSLAQTLKPVDDPVTTGHVFLRHPNWPPGFVSQWDTVFHDWARANRARD